MTDVAELRHKLIELSELGQIKQKKKFLKEANDETIELLWKDHQEKLPEDTN